MQGSSGCCGGGGKLSCGYHGGPCTPGLCGAGDRGSPARVVVGAEQSQRDLPAGALAVGKRREQWSMTPGLALSARVLFGKKGTWIHLQTVPGTGTGIYNHEAVRRDETRHTGRDRVVEGLGRLACYPESEGTPFSWPHDVFRHCLWGWAGG